MKSKHIGDFAHHMENAAKSTSRMRVLQRHESPDELLCLLVGDSDGNTCIGFDGFIWHTHGDILAALFGLPEEEAVASFVAEILSG